MGASTIVLIPARNEEATVGGVVRSVRAALGCDVAVIDDVSTDRTAEAARAAGAAVLPLALHLGAWGAMQTGLRYALNSGYEIAVTMDADGQHPASALADLVDPIRTGRADVVIGACVQRGSRARHVAWALFRFFSGVKIQDLTSGFRAYNRTAVTLLASRRASLLDYQDLGVLLLLKKAGLRILEVPVAMSPRRVGYSRVFSSWWAVGRYMLQSSILCLAKRLHLKPWV